MYGSQTKYTLNLHHFSPQNVCFFFTEFCPDKSESQETKITDLTDTMNNMGSETLEGFVSYIKNESGLQSLIQLVKSGIGALKQQ